MKKKQRSIQSIQMKTINIYKLNYFERTSEKHFWGSIEQKPYTQR